MFDTGKRKIEDTIDSKKIKYFVSETERQEYITSNEWPVFTHPEGGIIKITPWGSLRQFPDENGDTVTKFEDKSFQDYPFDSRNLNNIYEYTPSTPKSLSHNFSPSPDRIKLSPSDEAENYVINGYQNQTPNSNSGASKRSPQFQDVVHFPHEHENYFGMEQHDDVDYIDQMNEKYDEEMK